MNIILCLYTQLREDISNYVIKIMGLPSPIICLDLFQLAELYEQSLPATLITSSSIYADPTMDDTWADVLKDKIRIRIIIIPDNPSLNDRRFILKIKEAIFFCIDEPTRIMNSICLAGVTMTEHCNNGEANDKLRFGIKRIMMKDVIYGHPYNIIANGRPFQRYIYRSKNRDTILVGIDRKLTPNEYKGRNKLHEIPKKDILSIMKICYELREF